MKRLAYSSVAALYLIAMYSMWPGKGVPPPVQAQIVAFLPPTTADGPSVGGVSRGCGNAAKGSPSTLIAATTNRSSHLVIQYGGAAMGGTASIDVMVGAASSETVVIPNMLTPFNNAWTTYSVPMEIAAGSRISARCQETSGSSLTIAAYALSRP